MGYRDQQERDEKMRREQARAWAKLPLRKRILVFSSFLALIAFLALAVASMIWPGFG